MQNQPLPSFSTKRSGRPRPADLLSSHRHSSEARPWPSPSFDTSLPLLTADDVFADPGRPSSQLYTPTSARFSSISPVDRCISLPHIADVLPEAAPLRASSRRRSLGSDWSSSEGSSSGGTLPVTSSGQFPSVLLPSRSGFEGPPPEWVHSSPGPFTREVPGPALQRSAIPMGDKAPNPLPSPISPSFFEGMPTDGQCVGLGLQLAPLTTPRPVPLPEASSSSRILTTPSAPRIGTLDDGVFGSFPASLGTPRMGRENMRPDLDLTYSSFSTPSEETGFPGDNGPGSAPMEREGMVQLEERMPSARGLVGLGISFDGGNRSPPSAPVFSAAMPAPPPTTWASRSAPQFKSPTIASSSAFSSGSGSGPGSSPLPNDVQDSTPRAKPTSAPPSGSVPTPTQSRLTPLVRGTRKLNLTSSVSPTKGVPGSPRSPSLRTQGKQQSEQLRTQAAAARKVGGGSGANSTSPRKRGLAVRTAEEGEESEKSWKNKNNSQASGSAKGSANTNVGSQSPWGVFGLDLQDGWKPLGPPVIAQSGGSAKKQKRDASTNHEDNADRARARDPEDSPSKSKAQRTSGGGNDAHLSSRSQSRSPEKKNQLGLGRYKLGASASGDENRNPAGTLGNKDSNQHASSPLLLKPNFAFRASLSSSSSGGGGGSGGNANGARSPEKGERRERFGLVEREKENIVVGVEASRRRRMQVQMQGLR